VVGELAPIAHIEHLFELRKGFKMDFLTQAQCDRCGRVDSYYGAETFGVAWIVEDCSTCGAEGQFHLKIAEVA
jgi:hypothetical protein